MKNPSVKFKNVMAAINVIKILKKITFIFIVFSCYTATLATATTAGNIAPVKELNQLLLTTKTMQADFRHTILSKNNYIEQESNGKVALQKPRLFKWQVMTPEPNLIISDGDKLWQYDELLEQVIVSKLQIEKNNMALYFLLASDFKELDNNYVVKKINSEEFKLIPKQDKNFQAIELKFIEKKLMNLRILDYLGKTSVFRFYNVKLNNKLPLSYFKFTIPEGVDVIGEKL